MPSSTPESNLTAFVGFRRIASGPRSQVIAQLRKQDGRSDEVPTFVFDDGTGERLDLDLRDEAAAPALESSPPAETRRAASVAPSSAWSRARSRCCRAIGNGSGASPAAHRWPCAAWSTRPATCNADRDAQRAAREATYRFMTAIAGDLPGFEEATRALFAGERARFDDADRPLARRRARASGQARRGAWSAA